MGERHQQDIMFPFNADGRLSCRWRSMKRADAGTNNHLTGKSTSRSSVFLLSSGAIEIEETIVHWLK